MKIKVIQFYNSLLLVACKNKQLDNDLQTEMRVEGKHTEYNFSTFEYPKLSARIEREFRLILESCS